MIFIHIWFIPFVPQYNVLWCKFSLLLLHPHLSCLVSGICVCVCVCVTALGYVSVKLSVDSFRNVSTIHLCDWTSCIFDLLCLMIYRKQWSCYWHIWWRNGINSQYWKQSNSYLCTDFFRVANLCKGQEKRFVLQNWKHFRFLLISFRVRKS